MAATARAGVVRGRHCGSSRYARPTAGWQKRTYDHGPGTKRQNHDRQRKGLDERIDDRGRATRANARNVILKADPLRRKDAVLGGCHL